MDPSTPLDHALFHLTPTRTRCDLLAVPFGKGAAKEKIASGLVEPFLTHLRSARDQIPKGGYSFTLRPPRDGNGGSRWFTKGTLERFVRFVATPEILERVVTIEKEIVQIEESIHREDANSFAYHTDRDPASSLAIVPVTNGGTTTKHATPSPTKSSDDPDKQDAADGENSKVCLLRALETRKTILYKEQGMAYARAAVAGFDKDTIDDLISFADAFGATRLREACVNFLEVCKEKEKDKMWMDELAALEASRLSHLSYLGASGIMLTADNNENNLTPAANSAVDGHQGQNGSNEDPMSNPAANGMANAAWNQGHFMGANLGNHGFPMGWPNHPQFPGYAYPGMPFMHPYPGYPDGSQWPPRNDDERSQVRRKSGKVHRSSETALSSRDGSSDDDNSNPESGSDEKDISTDVDSTRKSRRNKKSHKKSSRMVVIRNINYISPKGKHEENDSSDKSSTNDVLDGDFLRRHVEDIVGSLEKHDTTTQHPKKKGEQRNAVSNDLNDADDVDGTHESANRVSNQGWDAFQNILMREEPDASAEFGMSKSGDVVSPSINHLDGEYRKSTKPKTIAVDPILGATKSNGFERNGNMENFEHVENHRLYVKRSQNTDEELLFSHRGRDEADPLSGGPYTEESSRLRGHSEGDWYVIAGPGRKGDISASRDPLFLEDNQVQHMKDQHVKKEKLDVAVDDSFIAPVRAVPVEKQPFSLWETDMSIISGVASGADKTHSLSNSKETNGNMEFHEPEELQLMLGRNLEVEQFTSSWTPEIDYSVSAAHGHASDKNPPEEGRSVDNKLSSDGKDAKTKLKPATKAAVKPNVSSRSFSKNKLDALSKPRTVSSLNKRGVAMSKAEKEEAERKRVEEQVLERQRRIAERSATKPTTSLSRQSSGGTKPTVALPRQEKKTTPSKLQGSQLSRPAQVKV